MIEEEHQIPATEIGLHIYSWTCSCEPVEYTVYVQSGEMTRTIHLHKQRVDDD